MTNVQTPTAADLERGAGEISKRGRWVDLELKLICQFTIFFFQLKIKVIIFNSKVTNTLWFNFKLQQIILTLWSLDSVNIKAYLGADVSYISLMFFYSWQIYNLILIYKWSLWLPYIFRCHNLLLFDSCVLEDPAATLGQQTNKQTCGNEFLKFVITGLMEYYKVEQLVTLN